MFGNTQVKPSQRSTSVIIKFDDKRGVSELQLPLGMEAFPQNDYSLKKQLFFKTYQTYRKFIQEKIKSIEGQKTKGNTEFLDQDTVIETTTNYQFKNSLTNESLSYQKLVMFDSILNAYDELKIQSLQSKLSRTEYIDYSKIHKYLHNAVYLKNNAIYIDSMDLPKRIIKDASTELVELFCYIYSEIIKELDCEPRNPLVLPLANSFKETRLFEESSLFAEDTYEDTISILKAVLDEIDQTTAYKDFDYWHFYDAIYNFLYSNNDGEWSIDNFSFIWERMCLAFAEKHYDEQIRLYDDFSKIKSKGGNNQFINYFSVGMNSSTDNIRRHIRPDLVMEKSPFVLCNDFLEKIYQVEVKGSNVDVSKIIGNDYRQYGDVETLKNELFKTKPRIQYFFEKWKKYPRTFTLTQEEYSTFKERARDLLQNHRTFFELVIRVPNVVDSAAKVSNNEFLVVDYKYMTEEAFQLPVGNFVEAATRKQYVYELALKLNRNATSSSEFWIPGFIYNKASTDNKQVRRYSKNCDSFFKKYKIPVIQLDFLELQKNYVDDVI